MTAALAIGTLTGSSLPLLMRRLVSTGYGLDDLPDHGDRLDELLRLPRTRLDAAVLVDLKVRSSRSALGFGVRVHALATAGKVPVAVGVVDPGHVRPELVAAQP